MAPLAWIPQSDGRIDLVAAAARASNPPTIAVTILPGNGDGTFGNPIVAATYDSVQFALGGDLNGDGFRDLVIAAGGIRDVHVLPGRGDFTFGTPVDLESGLDPVDGIVADVNGDGRKDLMVANHDGGSRGPDRTVTGPGPSLSRPAPTIPMTTC
jgi:hypothetical protein